MTDHEGHYWNEGIPYMGWFGDITNQLLQECRLCGAGRLVPIPPGMIPDYGKNACAGPYSPCEPGVICPNEYTFDPAGNWECK